MVLSDLGLHCLLRQIILLLKSVCFRMKIISELQLRRGKRVNLGVILHITPLRHMGHNIRFFFVEK